MFNKLEMIGAIAISIVGGFAIGYSKAREKFCEALIRASADKTEETNEKES